MILTQPRSRMAGASRRLVSIAAVRSRARVSCHVDSRASKRAHVEHVASAVDQDVNRPAQPSGGLRAQMVDLSRIGQVGGDRGHGRVGGSRGPLAMNASLYGAADAGGAAGDQGAAAAQVDVQIHRVTPSRVILAWTGWYEGPKGDRPALA